MEKIKKTLGKATSFLSQHVIFMLITLLFLPDYLFYPLLVAAGIFVMYEFIRYHGYRKSFFWILFLYLAGVAIYNDNTRGLFAAVYLIVLVAYAFVINRRMNPRVYMEMQFYIAWASLFNFFFNFIQWRPSWAASVLEPFRNVIDIANPSFYGVNNLRAFSTFDNANLYAFILMIVILVCFNQLQFQWTFKNYRSLAFYFGTLLINVYALLITGTRSIIPATLIGCITIVLVQRKWLQVKFLLLIGACFVLFILMNPDVFPRFMELSDGHIRLSIWETALNQIRKEPWLGKGLFTYDLLFDNSDAHNIFIESLLSFGIVGTSLMILYFSEKAVHFYKHAYYLDYPLALAVVIATITFGIFDIPLFAIQTSLLFVAVLCLPMRNNRLEN